MIMENDFSFIKLFKNNFKAALVADDTPISTLRYNCFIVQKPDEVFLQTTAGSTPITFAGGIQVDLIDCNGIVLKNIDANFYYNGFVDTKGIEQISFAFGFIGTDYWSTPLYLKITDLINSNVWYSNSFLVSYYKTDLSTRFDYFNKTKLHNISYDLAPYIQSMRLSACFDQTPVNKKELKQYINASGTQTNYRQITTFLRKYLINAVDNFINDRLEVLFSHQTIYLDRQRAVISDYKPSERMGDTNIMKAEFISNKQGQILTAPVAIFEYLDAVSKTPAHLGFYTIVSLPAIQLTFNKNITLLAAFSIKIYKDGVLQAIAPTTYTAAGNVLSITPSYSFTNGFYCIVIEPDLVVSGGESWKGYAVNEWSFTVASGEYDKTEYNGTDYL